MQTVTHDTPVATEQTGALTIQQRSQLQRSQMFAGEIAKCCRGENLVEVWEPDTEDAATGRCWIWMYAGGFEHIVKHEEPLIEASQIIHQWAICLRRGCLPRRHELADRLERVSQRIEQLT